jgi:hypothetical protein
VDLRWRRMFGRDQPRVLPSARVCPAEARTRRTRETASTRSHPRKLLIHLDAGVAKLADARDLKSRVPKGTCGFDPRPRHQFPEEQRVRRSLVGERFFDVVVPKIVPAASSILFAASRSTPESTIAPRLELDGDDLQQPLVDLQFRATGGFLVALAASRQSGRRSKRPSSSSEPWIRVR